MRHLLTRRSALLLAAVLALGTVACGDDGPTNGETNQGTGDPSTEDTSTVIEDDDETPTTGSVATPNTEVPEGEDPGSGDTGGGSVIPPGG